MSWLAQIFVWWRGATIGTRLFTARRGRLVGEDEFGNKYYETADGARRWVIYADEAEASSVPADWHGWLHRTYDKPPTEEPLTRRDWEKPHRPNMTGTDEAYRPKGSILRGGRREESDGDYQAWKPE